MIQKISFETIYKVWETYLWDERTSAITSTSAMDYKGGYHIMNMSYEPTFFGYYENNNLIGVNSGHRCRDESFRSRGLYVHPSYRKKGIGKILLTTTIEQGRSENCTYVWSYPRKSSWGTYASAGFILDSDWEKSETNYENAYCIFRLT